MTLGGQLIALFPALSFGLIAAAACGFVAAPAWWTLALLLFAVYGFPLLCFHLHERLTPVAEGWSDLEEKAYSAWWGAHQIQHVYAALPWLESPLRLVPGLYSLWLRAWGSHIGRGIFWPPELLVSDRSLLEVGDRVAIGSRSEFYAHMIVRRRGTLHLYVRRVRIGPGALIGAHVGLGPGSEVSAGAFVRAEARVYPDQRIGGRGSRERIGRLRKGPPRR